MVFGWSLLLAIATCGFWIWSKYLRQLNFWKHQNIELISIREFMQKTQQMPWGLVINEYYQEMYAQRKPFKVIEGLLFTTVIVQDLEAIKDIMITQFEKFPDRGFYVNHRDALSTSIARLDYDLWKPLRQKLSPTFSPAKLKYMYPTMDQVGGQLVAVIQDLCESGVKQMEVYDLCARYTTDIIGNVAFGLECNSLREPNTEFRVQGDRAFYQLLHPFLDLLAVKFPRISRVLDIRVFDKASNEFFINVFKQNLEYRQKHNIRRQDFMDILIEMQNQQKQTNDQEFILTLELMVGQVFGFFVGGFETGSCTMAYALYELAKNPDWQDKAREEILQEMSKNKQSLNYEGLRNLKVLKQIIQETLRLHPIIPAIPRICRQPCTIHTTNGSLDIKPGTSILIPIYGVQHNPDYFSEPEKFHPERFSDEAIAKSDPYSFLAFGAGPKVCIGELFGRLQMTLGLAKLLAHFRFSICSDTPKMLKFDPKNRFLLYVKGGIQLKVEKLP